MKTKLIIAGSIILVLYLYKRKKDSQKETQKMEVALKANELSAPEQLDLIRLKLDDFLHSNWPFQSETERVNTVVNLTSNLEEYKQQFEK